jgi:HlyD family secretion protein
MAETKKQSSLIKFVATLLLLGSAAWTANAYFKAGSSDGPAFQTTTVDRGDIRMVVTTTGQLNPVLKVEVGSQVSGIIQELLADFNSVVKAGQVIARIDPSTFEANVNQAEAELESAEAALELARVSAGRIAQLQESGLVSQGELDQARANLRQAEAALRIRRHSLERAHTELARCTIYSPIAGIVISRNVDVGQTVAASMTAPILFNIANDLSEMQINSNVPEADIGRIDTGQRVEFTVDAYPNETFTGEVIQVRNAPIELNNVVTYDTVISVNNPRGRLKPGMTATLSIVVAEENDVLRLRNAALRVRLPDHLRPPAPAAMPDGTRLAYRLASENGGPRLEPVPVTSGISDGVHSVILSGLNEGDLVVTGMALQSKQQQVARSRPSIFGPRPAEF